MNIDMISNAHLLAVILMGACIGGIAGYIGSLMVTKRMALMSDALGHLALPGVTLGLLYGFDTSIGALIFLLVGIFVIWLLEQWTHLPFEALTAVVFSSSLAITFLFLPEEEAYTALIGDIMHVPSTAVIISVVVSLIIFFVIKLIMPRLVLSSISQELALVEGYNISLLSLIYLICIALTVAMGVRIVGGLLTSALISIPACSSSNLCRNLTSYSFASLVMGMISCIFGIGISIATGISAGPLIIVASGLFFIISLLFKK